MSRRAFAWALLGVGLVLTLFAGVQVVGVVTGPGQPWSPLLRDNVVFASALPFLIGFGLLLGAVHVLLADTPRVERRGAAIRRFGSGRFWRTGSTPSASSSRWARACCNTSPVSRTRRRRRPSGGSVLPQI